MVPPLHIALMNTSTRKQILHSLTDQSDALARQALEPSVKVHTDAVSCLHASLSEASVAWCWVLYKSASYKLYIC